MGSDPMNGYGSCAYLSLLADQPSVGHIHYRKSHVAREAKKRGAQKIM